MRILSHKNSAFTLIEILVSLAIVAVLSTVVVVTLNPAELMKQARDSNRISDLNTINTALGTYAADVVGGSVGASSTVYVSLPSNNSDCSDLGLPALPSGWVYKCTTRDNLTKIDGTGWIPVNFQRISFGNPLEKLPIDQKNTTSTGLYYTFVTTGSWWELTSILESDKYGPRMVVDGGASPNAFEQGTSLTLTPIEALDRGVPPSVNTPTISSISPTSTIAGDPGFTLAVIGTNFTTSSVVKLGGSDRTTTFVSDTQLAASILAGDISTSGTIAVTVSDPVRGNSGSASLAISERIRFVAGSWTIDSTGGATQGTGSSIVEVAGNIYILVGGTGFQKYNPATKTWSSLTSVPASAGTGAVMTKYGSNEIYVFAGNSTAGFYKYTISTDSWTSLASAPAAVGNGGSLSYPGSGDYIYAFRGSSSNAFWRYSISNNSWGESGTAQGYGTILAEANGKFYVLYGNSGTVFKEYNPATKAWTTLAVTPSAATHGAAITKYNSDTLYAFMGGTTGFYKYTISTDSWTSLATAPAATAQGGSLSYPGSGDYIYAFRGSGTSSFWRYSISNNSWGESGTAQGAGAVIAEAGGRFYVMFGNSGTVFKEYNPATKAWSTLAVTPSAVGSGAAITRYDSDTFYAFMGGTTGFYKYTISTDSWTSLSTTTAASGTGGSLIYPGSGDYIYAFRGANTNTFWKYSISGDSWTSASNAPANVGAGGSLVVLNSTTLYALQGNIGTGFWQYDISTGLWATKAVVPSAVNGGGPLLTSDGAYIYALKGTGTAIFWKYDPVGNSWSTLANAPASIATNSNLTYGGLVYSPSLSKMFAITGRSDGTSGSILEYNPALDLWAFGPYAPATVGAGGSLTALNSNKLYAWQGSNGSAFWEYDIPNGIWTAKTSAPGGINGGGPLLTSDGTYIYALRGLGTTTFWKYDPAGNSWSTLTSAPTVIASNSNATYGGLVYSSSLSKMFAVTGKSDGISGSILEYNPSTDLWAFGPYAPANVSAGGSLTALNSATLYAIQGGIGTGFWQYDISAGQWNVKAVTPIAIQGGSALLASDGTSIYAFRGSGSPTFWNYDPIGNSWSTLSDAPGNIASNSNLTKGGLVYSPSLNTIFGITGNSGAIYKNSP